MKFVVSASQAKMRLDKFLTQNLTDYNRSQIKKLIKSSGVLINNKPAKVHQFLKVSDTITIVTEDKKQITSPSFFSPSLKGGGGGGGGHLSPKVIFEDNDFLILEKPSGLLVHPVTPKETLTIRPARNITTEDNQLISSKEASSFRTGNNGVHPTDKNETDTLVSWLLAHYPNIKDVGEEKYREGIIHRLDRDVSGIMIVAKTQPAYYHLKEQFKKRLVRKEYIALVYGKIAQWEGKIDLPIGRSRNGQFVAHPRLGKFKFKPADRVAKTKYQVLEYIKDYTLIAVQILTGRTHQIRAHFSAIGHPILGDQLYRPRKKIFHFLRRKIKVVNPGRIFLHSTKIGFYDQTNQWQEFTSPLPNELTDFMNRQNS